MVGVYRDSYVHWYIPKHNNSNGTDIVQVQQQQRGYKNGRLCASQDCVYANKADCHPLGGGAYPYNDVIVGGNLNQRV